jgi:hypothetical protein
VAGALRSGSERRQYADDAGYMSGSRRLSQTGSSGQPACLPGQLINPAHMARPWPVALSTMG